MNTALALPWSTEWIHAPAITSPVANSLALNPTLVEEWLRGISDPNSCSSINVSPSLDAWPWSEVVAPLLEDQLLEPHPEPSLSKSSSRSPTSRTHCASALIWHFLSNAIPAYPYIATTSPPCYACVALARTVNTMHETAREYLMRGCTGAIDMPWCPPWACPGSDCRNVEARKVEAAFEKALLEDVRMLLMYGARRIASHGGSEAKTWDLENTQSVLPPSLSRRKAD